MEMRGRTEKTLLAHFALERALRQVSVRLTTVRAVGAGEADVVLHGRTPGAPSSSRAAAIAAATTCGSPM